ncbi:Rqc2 family fibronectin-binding protein [Desulfosporosinus meridiei]|uniref:Rqc2 homolog RqcH n=1 Tax=Desulfosporosinus meridiei (strain ATCC BAA-275 / DSM 13257 / KCTC 12902 / NCIMB 13706 / S10) TaxID=768704 RepID=J7IV80_DESMD|nr:NFACT RNA binding domain-containing protein [Desulfosporosinus meridiei]AFQ45640.1 putative RNA-binding protein, snRNP like protein [Desulfosporosinus meridiei DSM 13257]
MALDGVTLAYLVKELAPSLVGARIDKIFQPEKDEIHIQLRQQGSRRLLLNTSATSPRFHFTQEIKKNPSSPPMFCMILRKHLEGGKLIRLHQNELERVITFEFQNYNDRGDLVSLHLYLEIMGKHSNLILVDPQTNTILDGLKRYSHALSQYREVLPGRAYLAPPSQGKQPPLEDEEFWRATLYKEELEHPITSILLARFAGISPELAREIVIQAGLNAEIRLHQCGEIDLSRLFQAYRRLSNPEGISNIQPCLYYKLTPRPQLFAFSFLPFQQYQDLKVEYVPSLNDAIQIFYQSKSNNNTLESKRGSLKKIVQEQYSHMSKKLKIYSEAEESAQKGLAYQRWGELLTANLYRIPPGSSEAFVEDYYDPSGSTVTIPLNPHISAIDNAQRYYKLYNKAKATLLKTKELKEASLEEISYLESLQYTLNQAATITELNEIHLELVGQGYVAGKNIKENLPFKKGRSKSSSKSKSKTPKEIPQPRVYRSSQGRIILVGKNNAQNDWLSLRKGKPTDLWLHTKVIPGSHVLVPLEDGEEFPDDKTLEEAAALAIYFSQARGSSQVAVDYTHVKQLKKPNSAKPGMVIYDQNWTLYLTPKQEILEQLIASEEVTD